MQSKWTELYNYQQIQTEMVLWCSNSISIRKLGVRDKQLFACDSLLRKKSSVSMNLLFLFWILNKKHVIKLNKCYWKYQLIYSLSLISETLEVQHSINVKFVLPQASKDFFLKKQYRILSKISYIISILKSSLYLFSDTISGNRLEAVKTFQIAKKPRVAKSSQYNSLKNNAREPLYWRYYQLHQLQIWDIRWNRKAGGC